MTAVEGLVRLTAREEEVEEGLELGLSLGAKMVGCAGTGGRGDGGRPAKLGEHCWILTAMDFPSLVSPLSSSSSVSPSSANAGGGDGAGGLVAAAAAAAAKRAADSVFPYVGGESNPPSQGLVGWPPIRAFRINNLANQSKDNISEVNFPDCKNIIHHPVINGNPPSNEALNDYKNIESSRFIKVNMDGHPIGRKVNLAVHQSYESLALSLEIMFSKPNTLNHGMKSSKLLDGSYDFALTYEDKDGDWMLVGDIPWGMFLDTVRRLRIMRTSDANGRKQRLTSFNESCTMMRAKPS